MPLAAVLAVACGLALGAVVGFGLRAMWPWVFAEVVSGVVLGVGLVVALRAPQVPRMVLALASGGVMIGFVVGHWFAVTRAAPSPIGLGAFVSLKLSSEPVLGDLRPGVLGHLVVLAAQWLLVAASAWATTIAYGGYRGRGTPRTVRRFVAAQLASGVTEPELRAALSARGCVDPNAQTDALLDGARHRASERPC